MTHAHRQSKIPLQAGFTIIEVLIVLAIAGVIMLIVFQAVPTLERSSRNNQRKQDVQAILQDISHHELANSGNIPTQTTLRTELAQYQKLTYYDPANVFFTATVLGTSTPSMPAITNVEKVHTYNHAKCDQTTPGQATHSGAGYNDVVALYAAESGSGTISFCQEL